MLLISVRHDMIPVDINIKIGKTNSQIILML
jgi:hypothetical protein